MFLYSEGASPSPNLMEVKGSEAQGHHRELRSEGSVEQRCEPTDSSWIRGVEVGRVRMRARSPYPSSRWREMRACNDNAYGESKGQNSHDRLLGLTFWI